MENELAHGLAGMGLESRGLVATTGKAQPFVRLLPANTNEFPDPALFKVATLMDLPDSPADGKDAEENLYVPAGYTYFGQFIDHDLTFDTTSTLNPKDPAQPTNLRTPTLDLDCVYGNGPADQPYLFLDDGATMRVGATFDDPAKDDLPRVPRVLDAAHGVSAEGRAIIGDKRNDENSIVAQIQLTMIKFHNHVVATLRDAGRTSADQLFNAARDEVRWTYQQVIVEDYLRRIVDAKVYEEFLGAWSRDHEAAFTLYTKDKRDFLPLEFAGAAYRFGHSMVRTGYRLNAQTLLPVFDASGEAATSLTGFQPLPGAHVIDDWGRFFPALNRPDRDLMPGNHPPTNAGPEEIRPPDGVRPTVRLQFAYKIDPSLAGPLDDLPARISGFAGGPVTPFPGKLGPALALLNLRRGNKFRLATGQAFAQKLGVKPLTAAQIAVRRPAKASSDARPLWTFDPVPAELQAETPLWLYVLAEAQARMVDIWADPAENNRKDLDEAAFFLNGPGSVTQLGPVGGRILLETFFGVLQHDPDSLVNRAPKGWQPAVLRGKPGPVTFSHILDFIGATLTDGFGK